MQTSNKHAVKTCWKQEKLYKDNTQSARCGSTSGPNNKRHFKSNLKPTLGIQPDVKFESTQIPFESIVIQNNQISWIKPLQETLTLLLYS